MRTTLTIDPDVAAELEQTRRTRNARFKDIVNEALRRGLREINSVPKTRKPFRISERFLAVYRIDRAGVTSRTYTYHWQAFKSLPFI